MHTPFLFVVAVVADDDSDDKANPVPPTEGDSFLTALSHQQINPTLELEKAPLRLNPTLELEKAPLRLNPALELEKAPLRLNPTLELEKASLRLNPTLELEKTPLRLNPALELEKAPLRLYPTLELEKTPLRLYPTLELEKTPLLSGSSSTTITATITKGRSHNLGQVSRSEEDYVTACSNSPQLAHLLTTPSHADGFSIANISVERSGEGHFHKDLHLEMNSVTQRRRSSSRQKSPLATSVSKAPHLLLHGGGHDNKATLTKVSSKAIDPLPSAHSSAPPAEVVMLGKREPCSPTSNNNTPPFSKKSKVIVPLSKKVVCVKVIPPCGESLPMKQSPRLGSGESLSDAFARATESVIGKLLYKKRRQSL